jgi:hypothetical protein
VASGHCRARTLHCPKGSAETDGRIAVVPAHWLLASFELFGWPRSDRPDVVGAARKAASALLDRDCERICRSLAKPSRNAGVPFAKIDD